MLHFWANDKAFEILLWSWARATIVASRNQQHQQQEQQEQQPKTVFVDQELGRDHIKASEEASTEWRLTSISPAYLRRPCFR
jgi:hypothetical protein